MSQWCVVVMRNLRCRDSDSNAEVVEQDVVTVYGPFSKAVAVAKTEQFNKRSADGNRVSLLDAEPDEYRPIANAPAFIDQEHWDEHWATARPMNDVVW